MQKYSYFPRGSNPYLLYLSQSLAHHTTVNDTSDVSCHQLEEITTLSQHNSRQFSLLKLCFQGFLRKVFSLLLKVISHKKLSFSRILDSAATSLDNQFQNKFSASRSASLTSCKSLLLAYNIKGIVLQNLNNSITTK